MNNPLFGMLALMAIWQYIRWRDDKRWAHFWIGSVALMIASLAKPTAVVVPPILLVFDVAVFRRSARESVRAIVPWVMLTIPCVIWTSWFQKGAATAGVPLAFRPLLAGDIATFYLWKLIFPSKFCIDYGWNPAFIESHRWAYFLWLVPAVMLVFTWMLRRKSMMPLAGLMIFLLALLPNSGLASFDFQRISNVADRYVYIAMIGAALVVAWIVSTEKNRVVSAFVLIAIAGWVVQTERQIATWRDGETLYRHAMIANPTGWLSPTNLSFIVNKRSPQEAIELCRVAVENAPNEVEAKKRLAALLVTQAPDESISLSQQVLKLQRGSAEAYNNLGAAYWAKGMNTEAIDAFSRACRADPDNETFLKNYGSAQEQTGGLSAAESAYRLYLDRHPRSAVAREGLNRIAGLTRPVATQP